MKFFVVFSQGGIADWFLTAVKTDKGISLLVINKTMGSKMTYTAHIIFKYEKRIFQRYCLKKFLEM